MFRLIPTFLFLILVLTAGANAESRSEEENCPLDFDLKSYVQNRNSSDLLNSVLELGLLGEKNVKICDKSLVVNPILIKGLLNLGEPSKGMFSILFDNGLPLDYKLEGKSLLTHAFELDNPSLFDFFLKKGINIELFRKDIDDPILDAIKKERFLMLFYFLDKKLFTSSINRKTFLAALRTNNLNIVASIAKYYKLTPEDYLMILGLNNEYSKYFLPKLTYSEIRAFNIPNEYKSILAFYKFFLSTDKKKIRVIPASLKQVLSQDFILTRVNLVSLHDRNLWMYVPPLVSEFNLPKYVIFSLDTKNNRVLFWDKFKFTIHHKSTVFTYTQFAFPLRLYEVKRKAFVKIYKYKPLGKKEIAFLKKKGFNLLAKALSMPWEDSDYTDGPVLEVKCIFGCGKGTESKNKKASVLDKGGPKEFICKFYCDTGEDPLLQTKSKSPIRIVVKAKSKFEAERELQGKLGVLAPGKAEDICKQYGYKGGLYFPAFGSAVKCEEK